MHNCLDMCVKDFSGFFRMHARVPVIFSLQETKSWDAANLTLPGCVCYGSKFGLRNVVGFTTVLHDQEVMEV